jgi:hypothetical protein
MKLCLFACAFILAAVPASAKDVVKGITLVHGHPIHHESANTAGVTMGLSVLHNQPHATPPMDLCNQLRVAAGLRNEIRNGSTLRAVFIVPYKAMAVEGYYLPADGDPENHGLVPGTRVDRSFLDSTMAWAGIPPSVLDETNVEHEISCHADEPRWTIAWQDIRPIGEEEPGAVIQRARERFIAVYESVLERAGQAGLRTTKSKK